MILSCLKSKSKKHTGQYLDLAAEIREALTSVKALSVGRFASLTDEGKSEPFSLGK